MKRERESSWSDVSSYFLEEAVEAASRAFNACLAELKYDPLAQS